MSAGDRLPLSGPDGCGTLLPDLHATETVGRALGERLRIGDLVTLAGPLGAGKTSFARGVLQGMGFAGEVASPTFPIVIAYDPPEVRLPLAHVDLYRIDDASALDELGLDEAAAAGALLVEWPERGGGRLPGDPLALSFEVQPDRVRRLTWIASAAWERRWPPR